MAATLANRVLKLTTPLGTDRLLPERVDISERLSEPFHWTLDLVSEHGDLDGNQVLGKDVTLNFPLPKNPKGRFFHGFVTEFAQVGYLHALHRYRAVVRPWLWFLSRRADCRIFQHKSIPDIFEDVVKRAGFGDDYRLDLQHGPYEPWDYCVQYRETDFNFVSRLLEQEGIFYYFEHTEHKHVMVLSDDSTTHSAAPGYDTVPFFPPDTSDQHSPEDHFNDWSLTQAVVSGAYATTDYDFKMPKKSLKDTSMIHGAYAQAAHEIFDFPAELTKPERTDTARLAKIRIEELHAAQKIAHGRGNAGGMTAGRLFKLSQHPRADFNAQYLVTGTHFGLAAESYVGGAGAGGFELGVTVEAIDAKTPYRPARATPKPIVQGAQTAVVVGTAGAEIDTDEYARVKVQFPWDRHGKADENSSCWVRVAQLWAGKNWGGIHIPRIGQEVLVSFLEGDPDRPIITGRVYNGEQKPPYDLPTNATQSGIKSRSSKDGSTDNFNEIRFEDKKGSEQLFIQAEKDMKTVVEHDKALSVGNDEKIDIGHDRSETVGNDEKIEIKNNRKETVGNDEKIEIGHDRTTDVNSNEKLTVGVDETVKVGNHFKLTADTDITLESGMSKLTMKADGTIELKGMSITIDGMQSVTVKSSMMIELNSQLNVKVGGVMIDVKGQAMTSVSGAMLDLKGQGMAMLKGAITMIG